MKKVLKKLKPLYQSMLPLVWAPRYHVGAPWMNRWGLQALRVKQKQASFNRWRPDIDGLNPDWLQQLDENGVVAIPNFFPPEQFQRLLDECNRYETSPHIKELKNKGGTNVDWRQGQIPTDLADYEGVRTLYRDNRTLIKLAEYISHRRVGFHPEVTYEHLYLPEGKVDNIDGALVTHADRHYSTAKTIFYLDDVVQDGGGLAYYPKSHKITPERMQHERDISVREALRRAGRVAELPQGSVQGDMSLINPKFLKQYTYTQMVGKANTMLVVNTCGFHARSPLPPGRHRRTLRTVFHFVHAPYIAQKMFGLIGSPSRLN
jgi:hypothetical protein